jgi:hypothetical protein
MLQNSTYKIIAERCEKALQRKNISKPVKEMLTNKKKVFEMVAGLSTDEQLAMFETGVFNDLVLGYLLQACDRVVMSDETKLHLYWALSDEISSDSPQRALRSLDQYKDVADSY